MKKIIILSGIFMLFGAYAHADTRHPMDIMVLRPLPAPIVSEVATTSASVALPDLSGWFDTSSSTLNDVAKQSIYFQYGELKQICPAIYPPLPSCMPKVTAKGLATTTLNDLKPGTWYYVRYIKDSSIACIKAPCPTNERRSEQTTFLTLGSNLATSTATSSDDRGSERKNENKQKKFKRDLWYRTRGDEVKTLQELLIKLGFLKDEATGFFGVNTLKAVKSYQREVMHIPPTGKVGPLTRSSLHVED